MGKGKKDHIQVIIFYFSKGAEYGIDHAIKGRVDIRKLLSGFAFRGN